MARQLHMPVALVGHLIALKLLSQDSERRRQDLIDLDALKAVATDADWHLAETACKLITARGFQRDRDLVGSLASFRTSSEGDGRHFTHEVE